MFFLMFMFDWHFFEVLAWFLRQRCTFKVKFHEKNWYLFWTHWTDKIWMNLNLKVTAFLCQMLKHQVNYLKILSCKIRFETSMIYHFTNFFNEFFIAREEHFLKLSSFQFHALSTVSDLISILHLWANSMFYLFLQRFDW